jgi:hypothetical protein
MARCRYHKRVIPFDGILYCTEEEHDATVPHRFVDGTTLILDDKGIRQLNVVDEMERAIARAQGTSARRRLEARCAAVPIAERLAECMKVAVTENCRRAMEMVNDLRAELAGGA